MGNLFIGPREQVVRIAFDFQQMDVRRVEVDRAGEFGDQAVGDQDGRSRADEAFDLRRCVRLDRKSVV